MPAIDDALVSLVTTAVLQRLMPAPAGPAGPPGKPGARGADGAQGPAGPPGPGTAWRTVLQFGGERFPEGNNSPVPDVGYGWPGPGDVAPGNYNTTAYWLPLVRGGRLQNMGVHVFDLGSGGQHAGAGTFIEIMVQDFAQVGPVLGTGVQVFIDSNDLATHVYFDDVNTFDIPDGYLVGLQTRTIWHRGGSNWRCSFELVETP